MPSYKLSYFDGRGRAELIRLIFTQAGVQFVDERVDYRKWETLKKDFPFGLLPVLYIDGKPLCQSMAIARYLANEFKLVPEDSVGAAFLDAIVCQINEVVFKLPFMEQDAKKKAELVKHAVENNLGKSFEKIEKLSQVHDGPFLCGKTLSYGDLAILWGLETVAAFDETFCEKFPELKSIAKKISESPKIKEYLEKRPKSTF